MNQVVPSVRLSATVGEAEIAVDFQVCQSISLRVEPVLKSVRWLFRLGWSGSARRCSENGSLPWSTASSAFYPETMQLAVDRTHVQTTADFPLPSSLPSALSALPCRPAGLSSRNDCDWKSVVRQGGRDGEIRRRENDVLRCSQRTSRHTQDVSRVSRPVPTESIVRQNTPVCVLSRSPHLRFQD